MATVFMHGFFQFLVAAVYLPGFQQANPILRIQISQVMGNDMRLPVTEFMHCNSGGDNIQAAVRARQTFQQLADGTVF